MQRKTQRIVVAFSGLLLAALVSFALVVRHGYRKWQVKEENEARNLVTRFHENFNSRDLDGICRDWIGCESPESADRIWNPVLEDVKSKCGAFRQVVGSNVEVTIEPASIRAVYVSSFDRGQLREVFAFLNADASGTLKLANYMPTQPMDDKPHPEAC